MDLKDFTELGNDIGRRVNDAINNMNFDQLNRDVRDKVDQAFYDGPSADRGFDGLNGKLYHGEEKAKQARSSDFKLYRESQRPANSVVSAQIPVQPKVPGKISGIIMMVTGYTLAGVFGITSLVLGILSATVSSVGTLAAGVLGAIAGGFVPIFAAGIILSIIGTKRYGRVSRFKKYIEALRGAKFCAIKDMAKRTGKSVRFVCKDLQKMIERGFFIEGHIDDQKTCFIGTDEMYQQYIQARDSAAASAQKVEEPYMEEATDTQMSQVIAEGQSYIKTIREANDAIYNPEISEKLYRMENIVKKIFDYVKENEDQVGQLRRFMSYYMPTTEKLVNAYRELDEQTIQGENITTAKEEIARTLDTINEAYEKLYDSMYVDVAMDVSSDIAVLKTLFAQEGLSEDEISGGKK